MSRRSHDDEIIERLKNLRRTHSVQEHVDQKELEERLAKLKGLDPTKFSAPPITVYQPPDTRTEIQKADGLLSLLMEESALDTKSGHGATRRQSVDDQLQARLAKLRGEDPNLVGQKHDFDQEMEVVDSDEEASNVVERLLAESALPRVPSFNDLDNLSPKGSKSLPVSTDSKTYQRKETKTVCDLASKITQEAKAKPKSKSSSMDDEEEEELPWCVTCNEDARIKCHDCDGDLYCMDCFR